MGLILLSINRPVNTLHDLPSIIPGMRANTLIGQAMVQTEDISVLFTPSLSNITQIGSPTEIVEAYALVMADEAPWFERLTRCIDVLYACADRFDADVERMIGHYNPIKRRYTPGRIEPRAVIAIACQMMRHGVIGDMERQRTKQGDDYTREFLAVDMAAMAQAHLGVSVDESWQMTMTSIVRAMASKYPLPDDQKLGGGMTVEDNDRALAWHKQVKKLRGAKNG